jgi:ferritin heavy chain
MGISVSNANTIYLFVQMSDYLDDFLEEQVEDIKKISDYVTQLTRAGPGLGEYLFDKETFGSL